MCNDNFNLRYLIGSGGYVRPSGPPNGINIRIFESCAYSSGSALSRSIDVMELFGGESGVSKLCLHRFLVRGVNVDLVIGFEFIKGAHQKEMFRYIMTFKFLIIVMNFPRTNFGHWFHVNEHLHPDTWNQIRQVGEYFAEFAI